MGVNEVEWATTSGLRRRRRLEPLRRRPRSGNADAFFDRQNFGRVLACAR